MKVKESGIKIASGYLVDRNHLPGGGGFLVLEANNYEEAHLLIREDPMIRNKLVKWDLHEWIPIVKNFKNKFINYLG